LYHFYYISYLEWLKYKTAKPLLYTMYRTRNRKQLERKWSGKDGGGSEKQSALEWRWCQVADCSKGGFQPTEMHDRQLWTAVYVRSLAVRMTTTGDGGGWNRWCAGCSWKDTVVPTYCYLLLPTVISQFNHNHCYKI